MELPLNTDEQILLDQLLEIPPNFSAAGNTIREKGLQSESVTKVAIRYADECNFDAHDFFAQKDPRSNVRKLDVLQECIPGLHSTYICEVMSFLLEFGLDPNGIFKSESGKSNVMWALFCVDNEYLGVDALALLLEHGGDPNLKIDGDSIFIDTAFDICFGAVELETRWVYDIWVHRWMVLVAYGGRYEGDSPWPKTFEQYDENGHYGKPFDAIERVLADIKDTCAALSEGRETEFTAELKVKRGTSTCQLVYTMISLENTTKILGVETQANHFLADANRRRLFSSFKRHRALAVLFMVQHPC